MEKSIVTTALFCIVFLGAGLFSPAPAAAGIQVDIAVALPPLFIPAPPALIVIPGTPVYYPPAVGADIFFFNGYWYRPHRGYWFISGHFNGPWSFIEIRSVPVVLLRLPPVRHHFRTWEHDGFWDDHGQGHGKGKHHGRGRGRGWDDD